MPENKLYQMTDEDLVNLQKKSLELLQVLLEICDKNDLKAFLCGGACIGAVRHQGFIPWDDDIDIFMFRKDYEKLSKLLQNDLDNSLYSFSRTDEKTYTRLQIAAFGDENTTFIKERQQDLDISHSVRIDIVPLDGCPSGKIARKIQIFWALIHSMFIVGEPHTSKGKILEIISRAMLFFFKTPKSRVWVWKLAQKQMSKHSIENCSKITELCSWYNYMKIEYPKEIFEDVLYLDFEDTKVPVPVGYDKYLKMAFGDYMTLPKEGDQTAKHDIVYLDLNRSYKEYKGKFYCKKEN